MNFNPKAPSVYKPTLPKLAAPPAYRPGQSADRGVQPKTINNFALESRPAPPVYRPQQSDSSGAQLKPANNFRLETRPAPPVYRPQGHSAPPTRPAHNRQTEAANGGILPKASNEASRIARGTAPLPAFRVLQPASRAKRKTTEEATVKSKAMAVGGAEPSDRPRRDIAAYTNVEAYEALGETPNPVLNAAIKSKKIFSGERKQVAWSTGFADTFWNNTETDDGWCCEKGIASKCTHPDYSDNHSGLEIGHKKGFYTTISEKVHSVVVCDGTKHWLVMLFVDVVAANEDEDNLEPQCPQCNRDANQQKKDLRGGGLFGPDETGACPGPETCTEDQISDL